MVTRLAEGGLACFSFQVAGIRSDARVGGELVSGDLITSALAGDRAEAFFRVGKGLLGMRGWKFFSGSGFGCKG